MDSYVPNQVDNNEDEWSEFISKDRKETSENLSIYLNAQNQEEVEQTNASNDSIDNDTDDEWCETTERSSGVMDTLLQEPDITQDSERISFAPGEGNIPLGILIDKDSEFLSFRTIYLWQNVNLITVKDLCPFTFAQSVNGNYEAKIEESCSLCETYFTN